MIRNENNDVGAGTKLWWIAGIGLALAGMGAAYLLHDDTPVDPHYQEARTSFTVAEPQAMVAWRDPKADTAAFFPGATPPATDTPKLLALSRRRAEVQAVLGPDTPLTNNALYLYPVQKDGIPNGVVLLRRARGEWGAIEVVVGMTIDGKIVGVRVQRHREPVGIAKYITSPAFLNGFTGKDAAQWFEPGKDLPPAPVAARFSARAVAQAVRAIAIEYHVGSRP